jgi:hypothetical protein
VTKNGSIFTNKVVQKFKLSTLKKCSPNPIVIKENNYHKNENNF